MSQRNLPVVESKPEPGLPTNGHGGSPHEELNARVEHAQLLLKNRGLLLRFAIWGLLTAVIVALLIPAKYDSVTQLMPPDTDNTSSMMLAALVNKGGDALSGYAGNLSGYASNLLGIKTSTAIFVGVLRSRTVEDALVDKFDLRGVYWVRRWEDARKELEDRTFISEDRKSGIITIRVRDHRPDRAQAMAQAYVDQLNIAVATLSTSSARREREFLETRLKAVKQDLDQAAQDFSQFASHNTAINIPEQGKAMVEAAARLQGVLIAAEAQRQGLVQVYSANNARVRAAQANIDELRRQLNELGGAGTGAGGSTSETPLYPSIRQLPLLGVTYADLYRRTKIQEAVYETLTKQYELAKVQEAKEIPTVKVLDRPNYPERKASPRYAPLLGFGVFIALAIGCTWVVGKHKWQTTDPSSQQKAFLLDVASTIKIDTQMLWQQRRHLAKGLILGTSGRPRSSNGNNSTAE
jgi:capsule polysaccharide export protein KpsE/RkpR